MRYSDDPGADYDAFDREQTDWVEARPVCAICGEHIQDEYLFNIDGDLICEECLIYHYRKSTDDFIEER
jgi:formylmethanofuran dehydrogenase subunit E